MTVLGWFSGDRFEAADSQELTAESFFHDT